MGLQTQSPGRMPWVPNATEVERTEHRKSSEAVWVPHEKVCPSSPNVLWRVEISVLCAERDICMFSSVVVVQSSSGGSCPRGSKGSALVLFRWFCDPSLDTVYDCKGKKNIWTGQKIFLSPVRMGAGRLPGGGLVLVLDGEGKALMREV